jgi:hypothetical protein
VKQSVPETFEMLDVGLSLSVEVLGIFATFAINELRKAASVVCESLHLISQGR